MDNIRQIEFNNEQWYVSKDICDALNLKNNRSVINIVSEKYKSKQKINTNGGEQIMMTININGIKQILQSCRSVNKDKLISLLNIELDIIYDCKESSCLRIISSSFISFRQQFQYSVGGYRIDLYFPDYKLAIEIDEFGHKYRNKVYEEEREAYLKEKLGCKFIRFNPNEKDFNVGIVISNILNETLLK